MKIHINSCKRGLKQKSGTKKWYCMMESSRPQLILEEDMVLAGYSLVKCDPVRSDEADTAWRFLWEKANVK